jgi:hypothetical protein
MITAAEFLDKGNFNNTTDMLIEFAKLHVEECKRNIAEDYTYFLKGDEGSETLDVEKFHKESYPLDNIK